MTEHFINAVINLLDESPEDWVFNEYKAVNPKHNITIWLANSTYGLDVNGYGGVTVASSFFGWLTPWRVRVWRAAWRARARQLEARAAA